MEAARDKEVKL